jgi:hypothetical protein
VSLRDIFFVEVGGARALPWHPQARRIGLPQSSGAARIARLGENPAAEAEAKLARIERDIEALQKAVSVGGITFCVLRS